MISGTVNFEGNLLIKSNYTFGYVSNPGTGGSKPQPVIVGGSGCKEVHDG
jgi:hypothetical protein